MILEEEAALHLLWYLLASMWKHVLKSTRWKHFSTGVKQSCGVCGRSKTSPGSMCNHVGHRPAAQLLRWDVPHRRTASWFFDTSSHTKKTDVKQNEGWPTCPYLLGRNTKQLSPPILKHNPLSCLCLVTSADLVSDMCPHRIISLVPYLSRTISLNPFTSAIQ